MPFQIKDPTLYDVVIVVLVRSGGMAAYELTSRTNVCMLEAGGFMIRRF
jgi:choline dehydrogenase-like flavoprotein